MSAAHRQKSTTGPEILFERLPPRQCKFFLLNEFLFESKTSS